MDINNLAILLNWLTKNTLLIIQLLTALAPIMALLVGGFAIYALIEVSKSKGGKK